MERDSPFASSTASGDVKVLVNPYREVGCVLSIGKLAPGAQEYYLRTVADGVEEYYLGSGEAPGRWLGHGAERLALSGQVGTESLTAVLEGRHPTTGKPLWRASRRRLPGWDLTFSAPKSVSLLYALAPDPIRQLVVEAHEHAVTTAFGYLEREAGFVRRGHGGQRAEAGAGLVGASFRHRTSRAADPQLHTHVLLANLVATHAGDWRAIWSRAFYRQARTAGSLYQAVLRDQLTRQLRVSWRAAGKGLFEIAGIPKPVLRAFSRRRIDIEDAMNDQGASSRVASRIAALTTRPDKPGVEETVSLHDRWRREAADIGFGQEQILTVLGAGWATLSPGANRTGNLDQTLYQNLDQIRDTVRDRRVNQHSSQTCEGDRLDEVTSRRLQDELHGPDGLTARSSVFRRRDVVRALCDRLPAGAPAEAIEHLAAEILASPQIVALLSHAPGDAAARFDERSVFTTRELLDLEQQVLKVASDGQQRGHAVVPVPVLYRTLKEAPQLSGEQRQMITALCRSGNQVDVVVGVPGAGKTRGLAFANTAWKTHGVPVIGACVKASAAAELQTGAGIPSWTVARLLLDLDQRNPSTGQRAALPPGAVLVVDEAGMLGTRQLARLLAHAQAAYGKLVLVGDPKQLPSIDAAGLFPMLAQRLDAVTLTGNQRQTDPADRQALTAYRDQDIQAALTSYQTRGRLHSHPNAPAQREAMVTAWWNDRTSGSESVMLAYRRADIAALNQLARERMATAGLLTGPTLTITDDERDHTFQTGDRVLLRRNNYPLDVRNGDQGLVQSVDPGAGSVRVHVARTAATVTLPRHYLADAGLEHGYALTIHASQGITTTRTHVLGNDALFYEAGLVALSRHRDTCHLHITGSIEERDDLERTHSRTPGMLAEEAEAHLSNRLAISRADDAASTYIR